MSFVEEQPREITSEETAEKAEVEMLEFAEADMENEESGDSEEIRQETNGTESEEGADDTAALELFLDWRRRNTPPMEVRVDVQVEVEYMDE